MKEIEQLIEISRKYGRDSRYVIAGGGNTSYKNADKLWVKASGCALATITEDGFAVLDRKKLNVIPEKTYPADTAAREEEVKNDLAAACITKDRRPSVETSMHNALSAAFIVHLHPTMVNGLMCGQNAEAETARLFGDEAVYIPYTDPGYVLFKEVDDRIKAYKAKFGKEPAILLLQNHGIFVGADTTAEVEAIYDRVLSTIEKAAGVSLPEGDKPVCDCVQEVLPAIRMMLSKQGIKTLRVRNNALIERYASSESEYAKVAAPFSPDAIVYCKSKYIYLAAADKQALLKQAQTQIEQYVAANGYTPKVLLIKGIGLVAVGDNAAGCDIIRRVRGHDEDRRDRPVVRRRAPDDPARDRLHRQLGSGKLSPQGQRGRRIGTRREQDDHRDRSRSGLRRGHRPLPDPAGSQYRRGRPERDGRSGDGRATQRHGPEQPRHLR